LPVDGEPPKEEAESMQGDRPDPDAVEQSIRSELGEILDRLAGLPTDAFAERAELLARQEELRAALRQIALPGAEAVLRRWSEAATRRKADDDEPVESIVSPTEGAGGV
jgi:hypothetical protein